MSKVVYKMSYKHPNFRDTQKKNVAHVNYIACRPGVDMSVSDRDMANEMEKGIDDDGYARYINERPGSHGLFDADGVADINSVKAELAEHTGYVWRNVISMREEDAAELGYTDKAHWQELIRKKLPDVADKMDIRPSNLRWCAAVHMAEGHPHVHVMVWERNPERPLGKVSPMVFGEIRKELINEIAKERKMQLIEGKNASRDLLAALSKTDLKKSVELSRSFGRISAELKILPPKIAPKLLDMQAIELTKKVKDLADIMPQHGRLSLQYMPPEVQKKVKEIAAYMMYQPALRAEVAKNTKAAEDLASLYVSKDEKIKEAGEKAKTDLEKRICNLILRAAANTNRDIKYVVNQSAANNVRTALTSLDGRINHTPEQRETLQKMAETLRGTGFKAQEIEKSLQRFVADEHLKITKNEVNDIVRTAEARHIDVRDPRQLQPLSAVMTAAHVPEDVQWKKIKDLAKKAEGQERGKDSAAASSSAASASAAEKGKEEEKKKEKIIGRGEDQQEVPKTENPQQASGNQKQQSEPPKQQSRYDLLRDQLGVKTSAETAINGLAKIHIAMGMSSADAIKSIRGLNIQYGLPEKNFDKKLKIAVEKVALDRDTGKEPIMGKKEWEATWKTLGKDPPPQWMWQSTQMHIRAGDMIGRLWQSAINEAIASTRQQSSQRESSQALKKAKQKQRRDQRNAQGRSM